MINDKPTTGTGCFIIFVDSTSLTGFDGCRIFNAKVNMSNVITISDITPSGNRACDTTNIESKFLNAIKKADQLKFSGKKLSLNSGKKLLLQFNERIIIDEPEVPESINPIDTAK